MTEQTLKVIEIEGKSLRPMVVMDAVLSWLKAAQAEAWPLLDEAGLPTDREWYMRKMSLEIQKLLMS